MSNKDIADQLLRGKKKYHGVKTLKLATAIRVAAHRLGGVLTVKAQKRGFRLVKSAAKVAHRLPEVKPAVTARAPSRKVQKETAPLTGNKAIADQLLRGTKKFHEVKTLKFATAIRVAAHRLGGILTVKRQKKGFRLIKSAAKIQHRPKAKKRTPGKGRGVVSKTGSTRR